MPSALHSASDPPYAIPGETRLFGDVELVAAPFNDCKGCAFNNHQRVGEYSCGFIDCSQIKWVTPLQYITLRLTK